MPCFWQRRRQPGIFPSPICGKEGAIVAAPKPRIHEVDFCAQMAGAANAIVAQNPAIYPFHEARVEGYGTGAGKRKRKDLRFFDRNGKLVLCGEVKLPGTPEGPFRLRPRSSGQDAAARPSDAGVQYFFTWNVNEFVLWDRSLWDRPLLERRVRRMAAAANLASPEDVAREDNLNFIKTHFLPDLLRDLADIISGRRREWLPPDDIFIRSLESHLDWPVQLASAYILEQADKSKPFDLRVQRWMTRSGLDLRSHAARGMGQGRGQHGQDPGLRLGQPADLLQGPARPIPRPAATGTAAIGQEARRCLGRVQRVSSRRRSSEAATTSRC